VEKENCDPGGKQSGVGVLGDPWTGPDFFRQFLKNAFLLRELHFNLNLN
jgi:hypothetical protein